MAIVLRTDSSDQRTWQAVRAAIQAPVGAHGFRASVEFVDDPRHTGLAGAQLLARFRYPDAGSFVIVADHVTMSHPEHPLLVVDLYAEPGRTFRAVPSAIQAIENNLSIANMDFAEFADAADADGVFRDFPPA